MVYSLEEIPIIIMAGGKGRRMAPYTDVLPKPLLCYNGRTMLENVMDEFRKWGAKKYYVILCHQSEIIKTYLQSKKFPFEINIIIEEMFLGTAGGLKMLENSLKGNFIVCNCDNLGRFMYLDILEKHLQNKADITIPVKKKKHIIPFGVIDIQDDCKVASIKEKPQLDLFVSTGIHIMNMSVLPLIPNSGVFDMPDLIKSAINKMNVIYEDVGEAEWIDMSLVREDVFGKDKFSV